MHMKWTMIGIVAVLLLSAFQPSKKPTLTEINSKLETLDKAYQACCGTENFSQPAWDQLRAVVEMRRQILELEVRVEFLEGQIQ
jgi:hypothetical protein